MPKAPYIIFGYDVDPVNPQAGQIMTDVALGFPLSGNPAGLAIDNAHLLEVPASSSTTALRTLISYFDQKDQQHNGALRWFAQLCRAPEFGVG